MSSSEQTTRVIPPSRGRTRPAYARRAELRPGARVRSRWLEALVLGLCIVVVADVSATPAVAQASPGPRLVTFWESWLRETGPILSEEERLYFRILETDLAREAFVDGLWESRGAAALARWSRNRQDARRLRSRSRSREAAVRWLGKPGRIVPIPRCGPLRRLEIWEWDPWQLEQQGADSSQSRFAIFAEATTLSLSSFKPWNPADPAGLVRGGSSYSEIAPLVEALEGYPCLEASLLDQLRVALKTAEPIAELQAAAPWPAAAAGWMAELKPTHGQYVAELNLDFQGSFDRYTILRGRLKIPVRRLHQLVPGQIFDRVEVAGDIFRGDRLADSFEIVHHVAGAAPGEQIVLDFYRRLLPGPHRLRLRIADSSGRALLREERELDVPEMDAAAVEPAGSAGGLSRLTRGELVQLNSFPSVELLPPTVSGEGRLGVRAVTTGGPIASVEFRLDGMPVSIDDRPPYSATLGPSLSERTLTAAALDPHGRILTTDERRILPEGRPFAVRFGRPQPGAVRVPVELSLPQGSRVDRLECRHARRLIFETSAPPFECPLPEAPLVGLDYLTATAVLEGGEAQEDVLFLGPGAPEEVDVQLAEIYVSIFDGAGRPARGLGSEDVEIWEAGRRRPVARVEPVENLPLNVAVLMDISSSMGRSLRVAADSAQTFFESVLAGEDMASLLAFNHDLHPLVPFTHDARALRYGAVGLRAWGATRLHDAIAHALFQFTGRSNRRALIVLSDGSDVGSDFPLEQVLNFALEAGVMVYPILLGRTEEVGSRGLKELASRSGGRAFEVDAAGDLPEAYRLIEEDLRSQYLVVFEPSGRASFEVAPLEVRLLDERFIAREVRRRSQ